MASKQTRSLAVETKMVPVTDIVVNERNPNVLSKAAYSKLRNNIQRTGLYPALIAAPRPDGMLLLLDGHHRLRALLELGLDYAQVELWNIDEAEQRIALATLNRLRGEDDMEKRRSLVEEMLESAGSVHALAEMIPETPDEINDLLNPHGAKGEDPGAPDEEKPKSSIKISADQWITIKGAIDRVRHEENDAKMSDGRCLEMICAEFLAGH